MGSNKSAFVRLKLQKKHELCCSYCFCTHEKSVEGRERNARYYCIDRLFPGFPEISLFFSFCLETGKNFAFPCESRTVFSRRLRLHFRAKKMVLVIWNKKRATFRGNRAKGGR